MKQLDRYSIFFAIILLIALLIRLWGINYDLPYIYHPDEPHSITVSQDIFKTGDLNPHFFEYPSLFFYIQAAAYVPYYLIGKLLGIFTARVDILTPMTIVMGVTKAPMPTPVLLGRIITVIFSVGTVGITYLIGKQLTGKAVIGLFASFMLAMAFPSVSLSRLITPDTLVTFFAAVSFLASIFIYQQGRTRCYVIAGLCVGLTASTKYYGGLILLPMILAHFLHYGKRAVMNRNLYIALLMCGVGFFVGTPFALLDFPNFYAGLTYQSQHYSTGHPGMEGNTLMWYLNYAWRTGSIIYILSILGIIQGIYTRSKEIILLSSFPIVYFAFINSFPVRNDRTFLPLIPFMFLLAASFMEYLFIKTKALYSIKWRYGSRFVLACLVLVTLIVPATITVQKTVQITTSDSRKASRLWISDNLPARAKIALEAYSPYIDPEQFLVQGVGKIIDHDPDWYVKNGFEYLVFSEGNYGRYFAEPDRYSSEVSQYNEFFSRLALVKMFIDDNIEIRLYKLP